MWQVRAKLQKMFFRCHSYTSRPTCETVVSALLVWVTMMFVAVFVVYRRGYFLELEHPENSFLPHPDARFGDFNQTFNEWRQQGFGTIGYGMSYLPAMYVPVHILYRLFDVESESALIGVRYFTITATLALSLWCTRRAGFSTGISLIILTMLSYPYLLILQTGNLESMIVVLLVATAVFGQSQRWDYFGISVGLAAAMKGLPAALLLVPFLFADKRAGMRSLIAGGLAGVLATGSALFLLPGGFRDYGLTGVKKALESIRASQAMYTELMVNSPAGIHYGHSLLNSVHAVFGMSFMSSSTFGPAIFVFVMGLGLLSMFYIRRNENSLGLHLAVMGAALCLAPATSTDYKLMTLMPALLVLGVRGSELSKHERRVLLAIVTAMAPKPYFRVGSDPWGYASVYGTTLVLVVILLYPIVADYANRRNSSRHTVLC